MLCDRHTSHFNNDGQRFQFNTVTRITRLGTRTTEMGEGVCCVPSPEGRKQPDHERCWHQACLCNGGSVQLKCGWQEKGEEGGRGTEEKREGAPAEKLSYSPM